MDFPLYAERNLVIRSKTQGVIPFRLNIGQRFLHQKVSQQIDDQGYVRAVLIKARQWGGSTYIQGRFYKRVTTGQKGTRAFILTHSADATTNIFSMTKRFHDNINPRFRPASLPPSKKQLVFPGRDCSYAVATAGASGVGRSDTVQLFHGSEVAYWANAQDHAAGALQTVPSQGEGTEVFLESTGDGPDNYFHQQVMHARKGLTDQILVFVPWFWFKEYRATLKKNLDLSEDDEKYMRLFMLDLEQMQFRANKILEFGGGDGGHARFKKEYPATVDEAFTTDSESSYMNAIAVQQARKAQVEGVGPLIWGVDPSWVGKDRFSIVARQGRRSWRVAWWRDKRTTQSAAKLAFLLRQQNPDQVNIDIRGAGGTVIDLLYAMPELKEYTILPVDGAAKADDDERWKRKREEMWSRTKEWLEGDLPVQIEDDERMAGDLLNPMMIWDSNGRPVVETKTAMKNRHVPSPDDADALTYTWAYDEPMSMAARPASTGESRRPPPNWRAT